MKIAIYPGSFDPITLGHLNIVKRAAALFDKVIVCVMINSSKTPMFNLEERVELIRRVVSRFDNVEVDTSSKMLVDYARDMGATAVVKGLRVMSDFEAEFQMALINKKIDPNLDTVFLPASEKYTYMSSTVVKEMAKYGADLSDFVPREIIDDVIARTENKS